MVGRATYTNGLYIIQQALKPQYIVHASTAKRQISQTAPTTKEAARQSTASSLLAGKGSMIPTIAKGDQDDVDSGVYRIDQQLEGGVETEAAEPKKVSYTAVACSSYAHIQLTPPEPHLKAPYKIKIPQILREALQSPEAPHRRQTLTVKIT